MSTPRSRSPYYRRFPWEEPNFDPYKVVAELDRDHLDRNHHPREDHEEHLNFLTEDLYPEGQRRSPTSSDDRPFLHQRHSNQQDFYHKRPSPHRDAMSYGDRNLSPLCEGGEHGNRRRGGFREHPNSFENSGRSPVSPLRLPRERLPPTPRPHSDHQHREPGMGWMTEEQGRGRGRLRNLSPSARSDDQRVGAGWERGRRNTERQRESSHQDRSLSFKRQRREMEDGNQLGYRNEEDFGEPRYSMDTSRDRFGGDGEGTLPRGDTRHFGPLVIEHDHGIQHHREPSRLERFDGRGDRAPDIDQQRSPRPMGSTQERYRTANSRLDDLKDGRGRHFKDNRGQDDYHGTRRSPTPRDGPNTMKYGYHKGRGCPRQPRGRDGGIGPYRNQLSIRQSSQGYQDHHNEEQRPGYQPFRHVDNEDPAKEEAGWAEETRSHQWKHDRPRSLDRHLPNVDVHPKMPRQRMHGPNSQTAKNMTVVKEETLTIKVDMTQHKNKNSPLCYSSDRQLSFDLVNVGRQRLDFLPMLEHSGTYHETAMHTGTFAQEIITLVHHVKEQYFRDSGVTLNQRFSAPQEGSYSEETEELTLDQRFTSNRGFSLNVESPLEDDEPLFSRMGPLQPVRGPGDLRHDLERRRQERLEGVRVTISGNSLSQHHLDPVSDPGLKYKDEMDQMEGEGFSNWPEEQSRRHQGNTGPRRGASYQTLNSQRRNNRFGNRLGPMRRQNNYNNPAGPNW